MRKKKPEAFLTPGERESVEEAVAQAERHTSGEIKIFIDRFCWEDIEEKAARVFRKLRLDETAGRNGVLIYIVTTNREFLIHGDEGIDRAVPDNFWDDVRGRMQQDFRAGEFGNGLVAAIHAIGEKLGRYFPREEDDVNEISDNVEYGTER